MRDFSGGRGSPFQGFDGVGVGDIQLKRVVFDGSLSRDDRPPEFWGGGQNNAGRWCPRPELNWDQRFRKPLLYPFELRGLNY